jgi:arylsulfatase
MIKKQSQVSFLFSTVLLFAVSASGMTAKPPAGLKGSRPNIVLVITDDQGMGDLACMGNPYLRTPEIDRFYERATRFTDFQVSPTCAPTRSAMMSGRHPLEVGVTHTVRQRERLAPGVITFPQALQQAGYHTGLFGKWHLGDEREYLPQNRGFDEVLMHGAGGVGQYQWGDFEANTVNTYFDNTLLHNQTIVKTEGFCTDVFFAAATAWIKEQLQNKDPFFAYISLNAPHGPMIAPASYKSRFLEMGMNEKAAARYGMIENIDHNFGKLIAFLKAREALANTLIIFMTDNGMAMPTFQIGDQRIRPYNAGLRGGKNSTWEGGTHVPAFWRWDGVLEAGVDIPALTAHLDLYRTFCDLAGTEIPRSDLPPRGRSLLPLLENPTASWDDRQLFFHRARWDDGRWNQTSREANKYLGAAVRTTRWRLVFDRDGKGGVQTWLSDITVDPGEGNNLAARQPGVVAELKDAYDRWWDSTEAFLVNEGLPWVPKEAQPFTRRYKAQAAKEGIPLWRPSP